MSIIPNKSIVSEIFYEGCRLYLKKANTRMCKEYQITDQKRKKFIQLEIKFLDTVVLSQF